MKEFVISEAQTEKAVLVGLITQTQDERKTNEYLDELAFLAETAGAEVVKRFTQKLDAPHSVTYVGKGKLQEIKQYLEAQNESEETEIGMVIFDDELSAKGFGIAMLKTAPKGFPRDYEYIDYLRMKDYCCWMRVPDTLFDAPDWQKQLLRYFRVAKPMMDFINAVVDDYE